MARIALIQDYRVQETKKILELFSRTKGIFSRPLQADRTSGCLGSGLRRLLLGR